MRIRVFTALILLATASLFAQTPAFDSSGNGLLTGVYNFRQLVYGSFDSVGAIGRTTALSGTITFDGKGNYSVNGQFLDSTTGGKAYTITGTYSTAPSGLTVLDSPLYDSESVYGLVSRGVFVGSSTEGVTNDIFVAVAAGATPATAATLQGNYWVGSIEFPSGTPTLTRDALFQITANGQGNIAASTARGYVGTSSTAVTQSLAAFPYTLAAGTGTLAVPTSTTDQTVISGTKAIYVSSNGNFFIGGSTTGYDLVIGIKATSGTAANATLQGSYYQAGLNQDNTDFANSGSYFDSFYGALTLTGSSGLIFRHDRVAPFDNYSYDFTFDSTYSIQSDGTWDRPSFRYAAGTTGLGFIGIGKAPTLGIQFAVKAPDFSGTGVYINPVGIVNAASNAPFTAGIARGEAITIYGTALANSTASSPAPFPTTLGKVQVTINGRLAPLYFVSANQINAIVPYGTELSYAQIQVKNNNAASNSVTSIVNYTAPGIFSVPAAGIGPAAALHADYSLVSASSPAKIGETILVFLTGLGDVSPAVPEGQPAPSTTLSKVTNTATVFIAGLEGSVAYAGLAPGLAGLYQINVVVPPGVSSGSVYLEVDGADAATSQVKIAIK